MNETLSTFAARKNLVQGKLSGEVDVAASAFTPEALVKSLTGSLSGGIKEGRFVPGSLFGSLGKGLAGDQGLGARPACQNRFCGRLAGQAPVVPRVGEGQSEVGEVGQRDTPA